MSSALLIDNRILPAPTGGGWLFVRTWYAVDHPQSGVEWPLLVGQYAIMSAEQALDEANRLGVSYTADSALLKDWLNNGSIH